MENIKDTGKDLATTQQNALAAKSGISAMIEMIRTEFLAANDGLDLDFVHIAKWLVIDKKGNFVEKDTKDTPNVVSYGDKIDVVIGFGEKRWQLWGHEKSPEDGMLIVAEKEQADAYAKFAAWLEANPQAADRYTQSMIELCYIAYVVPVSTIKPNKRPKLYLISFSKTATIQYGKWAYAIFDGQYENTHGIPADTGVNKIVTRLSTQEMAQRGNASVTWLGLTFEPVGMYRPEDYGLPAADAGVQADAKKAAESDLPG